MQDQQDQNNSNETAATLNEAPPLGSGETPATPAPVVGKDNLPPDGATVGTVAATVQAAAGAIVDKERGKRAAAKTLGNSDLAGARINVPDIKVVGNGDSFRLLCKASSKREGWMKSTKAMEVAGGCVVQVTTQQGDSIAEALCFVPGVKIAPDIEGGRKLVSIH